MLYLFGWRNAEIWVFSKLVPKSIGHILPQNTQISLFIILLHSLNSCFYLHAFPTQLTYTSINSLAYSFRIFPTDSPSAHHDLHLAQVSCGTHLTWWRRKDLPSMQHPLLSPVSTLLTFYFKQWYCQALKERKITFTVKENMLQC